jgi:hypothetical protein
MQAKEQEAARTRACIANLKMIEVAKEQWAMDNRKTNEDTPAPSDLYGQTNYIREPLSCPTGGIYTTGPMAMRPTCSQVGHVLP